MRLFVLLLASLSISCTKTFAEDTLFGDSASTENWFQDSNSLEPNLNYDVSTTTDPSTVALDDWSNPDDLNLAMALNDFSASTGPDSDLKLASGCGGGGQGINKLRSRDEAGSYCSAPGATGQNELKLPNLLQSTDENPMRDLGLREIYPSSDDTKSPICPPPFGKHVCCMGTPADITQPGIFQGVMEELNICYLTPCPTVYEACCQTFSPSESIARQCVLLRAPLLFMKY